MGGTTGQGRGQSERREGGGGWGAGGGLGRGQEAGVAAIARRAGPASVYSSLSLMVKGAVVDSPKIDVYGTAR